MGTSHGVHRLVYGSWIVILFLTIKWRLLHENKTNVPNACDGAHAKEENKGQNRSHRGLNEIGQDRVVTRQNQNGVQQRDFQRLGLANMNPRASDRAPPPPPDHLDQ